MRINELSAQLADAQAAAGEAADERDASLQQTLQQADVLGAMEEKVEAVKAELASAQALNRQLHEQLLAAREGQVCLRGRGEGSLLLRGRSRCCCACDT